MNSPRISNYEGEKPGWQIRYEQWNFATHTEQRQEWWGITLKGRSTAAKWMFKCVIKHFDFLQIDPTFPECDHLKVLFSHLKYSGKLINSTITHFIAVKASDQPVPPLIDTYESDPVHVLLPALRSGFSWHFLWTTQSPESEDLCNYPTSTC